MYKGKGTVFTVPLYYIFLFICRFFALSQYRIQLRSEENGIQLPFPKANFGFR